MKRSTKKEPKKRSTEAASLADPKFRQRKERLVKRYNRKKKIDIDAEKC